MEVQGPKIHGSESYHSTEVNYEYLWVFPVERIDIMCSPATKAGFDIVGPSLRFPLSTPNGVHEILLENKGREIVQTSPQPHLSEKLYWCLSSAIWIPSRARRRSPRRVQWSSGLLVDCPDLTGSLDERTDISPQITPQVDKDKDQELPVSEASRSGVAIGVPGYRDEPTGERS